VLLNFFAIDEPNARSQQKTGGADRSAPPVPQGAIATLLVCK
jgi:hypothetical protein